ncbi:MAG: MucR family transcriptional regulator [Alphaproteobacteria bacterium]|nr:MucR family transcriptional regulator [Rhodospirillales bacterium]MCW9045980.1 MucR family transcriptional regulator [Alphaproteobacteria bacterium]
MTDETDTGVSSDEMLRMAVDIASAYLSRNEVSTSQVSETIKTAYSAIVEIEQGRSIGSETKQKPAVSIRRSITPDYIVCLEDGKLLKMLKRHLRTTYGLSPDEYRAKWGLPSDYPMVAPNYAKQRSEFAKKIGLGKK